MYRPSLPVACSLVGAALLASAALLPWTATARFAVDGPGIGPFSAPQAFAALLALASLPTSGVRDVRREAAAAVAGVAGVAGACWFLLRAGQEPQSPGTGAWLALAGGAALLAGGLAGFQRLARGA